VERTDVTGDPGAPVTLDDLADPQFCDEIRAAFAKMGEASSGLELAPGPLMEAAVEQTGLDDFGPDDFVERLDVLCRALLTEARLSPAGVFAQYSMLTGLLRNRLRLEDRVRRHPEILDLEVRAPVVICGLPRTGTTHLHNLMSADPALRSLPYWESLEPLLGEDEQPGPGQEDPRRARTERALWMVNTAMPHFNRMHEMTVDHVHEEIQLLAIDFSTMLFETIAPMPTWRDYYLSIDQGSSYAYLRRILKVLQWERGGTRWVLKSPQHLEQFSALRSTFPDATYVVTHRDPVSVTASMATMLAYSARMTHDRVDVQWISQYWADRLARMLGSCLDDREVLPGDQSIDVRFDQFMADDVGMVDRIYRLAGQPMNPSVRAAMESFMAEHPRGRYGTVRYDLAALGLDRAELRKTFAAYADRFEVAEESGI
jgi:Sulfotransferase family